jgi:hypothetical protein
MKKSAVRSFLNMLGFDVKEEALVEAEPQINAEPKVETVANAAPPAPAPAASPPAPPASPPAPPAADDNLAKLNQLITDIGGFEAFKAVLLAAVEMGKSAAPAAPAPQANRRAALISSLVTNAKGLTPQDLADVDIAVLEKMANAVATTNVDYAALGVVTNSNSQPAPRPVFLLATKAQ